jgi:signal transduction histidine kinase
VAKPPRAGKLTVAELRERLREAEETLDAIRDGHIDALVVNGPDGEQVFALKSVDHRYRRLVETMTEGALLLAEDDTILYANTRFSEIVGRPLEKVIATRLDSYVPSASIPLVAAILHAAAGTGAKAEVQLVAGDRLVPVYLSATPADVDSPACVIVTDLSAQKRDQSLLAAERLTAQIVEQATDGVVVCDLEGRIVRASKTAQSVAAANPFLKSFEDVFDLQTSSDPRASRSLLASALSGRTVTGEEVHLVREGNAPLDLLLSAGPIMGADGSRLGCVISFVDITDRKRAAQERSLLLERATEARADAEAANRAKDEFLAMLGHELRNPLAPILTALELMKMRGSTDSLRERAIIERHTIDVVRLVGDLLDVSRIAQGKVELERAPVEVRQLVEKAVEAASPLIEDRGHRLSVEVAEGLWIDADATRISQVLSNLLTNAAKYTQKSGEVSVSAARDRDDVVIVVRDNGMGISAELLPKLFDLFVQGRRTIERAEGGLGLGLSIVKNLVRIHGGTIVARSEGEGKGSEFELRLPALAHAEAQVVAERQAPAPRMPAGRRILIVDDNEDAAELLKVALAAVGYESRTAFNGPSALVLDSEFLPEIAVLDIGLPVMDGFELARRLREQAAPDRKLHLIALTGYGSQTDRIRTTAAGFDAHLVKPLDLRTLEQVLSSCARG